MKKRSRLTNESFSKRSELVHDGRYDYSFVEYLNATTKVKIICKSHGEFYQTPSNHLYMKQGCPKCASIGKSNFNVFIDRCKIVHENRYNYDKVRYTNTYNKIIIVCPEHGDFLQIPKNHIDGHGCPMCSNNKNLNTSEFIRKSNIIHVDRYIYDKVVYVTNKSNVTITCPIHGDFTQNACNHLNGQGCPTCNLSKGEVKIGDILKMRNYKYKTQYTFEDLKYKRLLKFDFAIFDEFGSLKSLVEFNGIQHYEYNSRFHNKLIDFETSKYRDHLKVKYCEEYKIPLFIIRYDEDIEDSMSIILG